MYGKLGVLMTWVQMVEGHSQLKLCNLGHLEQGLVLQHY